MSSICLIDTSIFLVMLNVPNYTADSTLMTAILILKKIRENSLI